MFLYERIVYLENNFIMVNLNFIMDQGHFSKNLTYTSHGRLAYVFAFGNFDTLGIL